MISTLNPTGLGPLPHLGAVIATTLLFFVAGYVVRQRLRPTIAGATLLGIAGAFVPMTIWTLGQERLLRWETGAIWLIASLVSLSLYLAVWLFPAWAMILTSLWEPPISGTRWC